MKILAIETATEACSAALLIDDTVLERYELAPQQHNRLILPMIDSLLAEAGIKVSQVDALAFGRGPGSFTGVRIAAGVAQGISFAVDLPVVPVSTLAALAQDALIESPEKVAFS
ncbi:MAG: tRNA (adenosine(37)-N6)-threonylcarbamoyltransferase complex dimerization subunit type 1 TsaB, partial [Methylocaldum sp.]|nr:tRNA (adenosine(37)-N6)-threonylcarbamoyltransferase complex dimerization subunit type 1 TsaB [Methylocaldum sp.]